MKTFLSYALLFSIVFAACKSGEKGDPGPAGPAGATGATGPAGPAGATGSPGAMGNANVIQFTFGERIHSGAPITYTLSGLTLAQMNSSVIVTYVKSSITTSWYQLPGGTFAGNFTYTVQFSSVNFMLIISRTAGTGNDTFLNTRVLVIPANEFKNGRKATVDYSNYEAVRQFYNLPD